MAAWTIFKVRRGDLFRQGSTFGKGFNSVKAVRMTVIVPEGLSDLECKFDNLKQHGGPITGEVEYKYIYVRNDGTYLAKSAPSAASIRKNFEAEGAQVVIPADASRDSQVNEIWLFRRGAGLETFYRVAVETGVSGTGAITIFDTTRAEDALIVNIKLEESNDVPPDDIIDIEGPYFDRLFALTASHLYPSRRLEPDTFSTEQVIKVAGNDERALWVKKALGGLYIGTTRDIYWLSGTGAELPDGSMEFTLQPINIDNPPVSEAVAQEGNFLVYLAADGWRALAGGGSELLTGATSNLWRGKTRHGVSPVNINGRFRACITRETLVAVTPEGGSTTSSTVIWRYRFSTKQWSRHVYTRNIRNIYRDPDGLVTFSDDAGFVWNFDTSTLDDGANIPVTMWTREDDVDQPFNRKDPHDLRFLIDTGGADATIGLHLDHATVAAETLTANNNGIGEELFNLTSIGTSSFRNLQFRITGSFPAFRLVNMELGFHPLPRMLRGHTPPSNFDYPGVKTTVGLQLRVCTLGAPVTITPVLDGVEDTPFEVESPIDEPINYTHMFTYPARQVEEYMLLLGGDVELYEWKPIVTAQVPLGTKVWDSGPMDLGIGEFIWPREVWIKAVCGDDLIVECWFDGINYGVVVAEVPRDLIGTAAKIRVPIPRGYKGRVPRIVITSCEPFFPYWYEFVHRQTRAKLNKPPLRVDANFGQKVIA